MPSQTNVNNLRKLSNRSIVDRVSNGLRLSGDNKVDLSTSSKSELEYMLRKNEALLSNKSLVGNLKDKGEKLRLQNAEIKQHLAALMEINQLGDQLTQMDLSTDTPSESTKEKIDRQTVSPKTHALLNMSSSKQGHTGLAIPLSQEESLKLLQNRRQELEAAGIQNAIEKLKFSSGSTSKSEKYSFIDQNYRDEGAAMDESEEESDDDSYCSNDTDSTDAWHEENSDA
ncbi:hypothetical protein K7432_002612 [Basidiobolus ranarum]|uniref:Uncharacterized protein n=1 Tax=Basidiobolus ranarum TaxID=34480 RepID=A0ABR2W813_9FUNG